MTVQLHAPTGWNVQYVTSFDGVRIAYATMGQGPPLLVTPVLPAGHLELEWQMPERRDWYTRMASSHQVIRYDPRGAGLSTREVDDLSHEAHVADLAAVIDHVTDGPLAILARHHGGGVAIRYAATHPQMLCGLILWHAFARASDYASVPRTEAMFSLISKDWELFTETLATFTLASEEHEANRRYAAFVRNAIEPGQYQRSLRNLNRVDCTHYLAQVPCPTLILQRRDVRKFDQSVGRSLATAIPDGRLVIVEGTSWALFGEDVESISRVIEEFLSDSGSPEAVDPSWDVMFTVREQQILRLLAAGKHNRRIADELCLSIHTIERHIANIYIKIGVHNRVEAAIYAFRHGVA